MDSPSPSTWDAVRWFLGGTIVFALGFEAVTKFREGKILVCIGSVVLAVGLLGFMIYWPAGGSLGQSVEKSAPNHNQSAVKIVPAFEAALVAKTRQLPAPEKAELSKILTQVSTAYDCAREAKQLFDHTTGLLGTSIDNKQIAGAVSPHIERLKQLREKINECARNLETAENTNRSYAEQVSYVTQRGDNPLKFFMNAIDETITVLQTWEKLSNRQDFDATVALGIPLARLREEGYQFSMWIEEGMKRIAMIRDANR